MNASYEPLFLDELQSHWMNDSLRKEAEELCQGDSSCLFDIAATRDLSVGAVSKNTSTTLEKEKKELGTFSMTILDCN